MVDKSEHQRPLKINAIAINKNGILMDGKYNEGEITGYVPGTAFTINAKLTDVAMMMLDELKNDVVDFKYNFDAKKAKLAQYAERVWNVTEGDEDEKAKAGIKKTEEFFHSLGIKTKLSEYTDNYVGAAEEIAKRFTKRRWIGLGENRSLKPEDAKKIVEMSY